MKQTHAEMLFKLRKPAGDCSLGRTAFTGEGKKRKQSQHQHQGFENTRSIDFQKKIQRSFEEKRGYHAEAIGPFEGRQTEIAFRPR